MNFIAGFLYLIMGCNESLAFGVMKAVIDKFNMGNLFNQELPMLKLNFYQLDRLISIVLSDLHTHFKVRNFRFIIILLYRMKQLIVVTLVHHISLHYLLVCFKCKLLEIIAKYSRDSGITSSS